MAAKKKNSKDVTPAQIKALKSKPVGSVKPTAKIGKPTVDPSKGKAPSYPNQQKTFDALNTAGKVATEGAMIGLGGGALVRGATKLAAKKIGQSVSGRTAQAAYNANMKGLKGATGMGGKVSRTQTPMGPTLRSTEIGTAKQQAARISNLEVGAFRKATRAGAEAGSKAMIDVFKAGAKVKQGGATLGGAAVTGRNRRKK
jgi:hypothetical protein